MIKIITKQSGLNCLTKRKKNFGCRGQNKRFEFAVIIINSDSDLNSILDLFKLQEKNCIALLIHRQKPGLEE